jgi:site-specific DNA recombinase
MNERAEQGKWNGGAVLGYKSKDKALVIVEEEANIIRHIFNLYINGKGYKAIANQLKKEGYRTKHNGAFAIATVRTIIINPLYAGFIRFNQHVDWTDKRRKRTNPNYILVKGEHERIISAAIWDAAVSMNAMKSQKPAKTFTCHFPLTGLLRCPMCSCVMIGHRSKGIRYYQCSTFHSKGGMQEYPYPCRSS